MTPAPVLFCLCLSLSTAAPERDRWVGEDKLKHFLASFVATSVSASFARTAGLDARSSAQVGAGVSVGLGVWKELRDARRPDATVSLRDLAWDLAGTGAGFAVMRQVR